MTRYITWIWGGNDPPRYSIMQKSIENVCFKGGGMKGNAFLGVDRAFTKLGIWPQIKRFIGSSAGAIFAGAKACRVPFEDMATIIENTDFSQFRDSSWGVVGEGIRIIEYLGWYEGEYFYNWYGKLLEKMVEDKKITLQGVYEKFGSELVITTTDLTKKKLVYLNRIDNPDLELRDAVRRSMSIPVFYVPVRIVEPDGLTHIYVDGGCTNNYPLDYFDDCYSSKEEAFGKTIGFDLENDSDQTIEINNVIDLVTTLIHTTIETIEQVRLAPHDSLRSIEIDTGDYKATDFDMKKEDICKLADAGYTATMQFFTNKK